MADIEHDASIDRREAIKRVGVLLGGVAFVGGTNLLTACGKADAPARETAAATPPAPFTTQEIAYLDEIAETILPQTKTPGAKAAKTGAFMALMVTDGYSARDAGIFRDGMKKVNEASRP
jgi:hypothetical protein